MSPLELQSLEPRDQQLMLMPMSGITGRFGVEGLSQRFNLEISSFPVEDQHICNSALYMVSYLHRNDQYKGLPYTSHLLRTAIRLIRDYEVTDPYVVAAMLLHDSVEDHPDEIISLSPFEIPESSVNEKARFVIARAFSELTADLVISVTNPELPKGLDRQQWREFYAANVQSKIAKSPGTFLLKLSDFTDNGLGFQWTENPGTLLKFAMKYYPLCDIFLAQLEVFFAEGQLSPGQYEMALHQLTYGKKRLEKVLGV